MFVRCLFYEDLLKDVPDFAVCVVIWFTRSDIRRKHFTDRRTDKGWFVEIVNLRQY